MLTSLSKIPAPTICERASISIVRGDNDGEFIIYTISY
jgi:hypothetical protein